MSTPRGATFNEWQHFDMILGLGDNLLPCVPASPDVRVLKGSALEGKVGKLPSQFNHAGEAHGLKEWQKRPIMSNEISAWSKDRRLNLCIRTGQISGVHVFDIDVDDREKAEEIVRAIEEITGPLPKRWRENSGKCTLLFRCEP
jgi:Bifunctional DNA primase/polymerase, N-terminal